MTVEATGTLPTKPRVLVAALDWGLGHASRCVPVIRELIEQGVEVVLAGEGMQQALLQIEFPGLEFVPLQGYRIRYPRNGRWLPWSIASQLPRLRWAIASEYFWLSRHIRRLRIDAVISDNRFGLHNRRLPCIFITHQLAIRSGLRAAADRLATNINQRFISRFSGCWVPDHAGPLSLAGELSHPGRFPSITLQYIGPLSRLHATAGGEVTGRLLILLSGPEPQRSI
ncbi:MAG TPA: glycosyl transferase family 28, partial [Chitinophagaceae bacterium]